MGFAIQDGVLNTWAAFFPCEAPGEEGQRNGGYAITKTKGWKGGGRREVPGAELLEK